MQIDVTPAPEDEERRALLLALELAELRGLDEQPSLQAWRTAGLREGVDDEAEVGYAFSPRSTRGATRA